MPEFQFSSFYEFVNMGGYAFFVWLAYLAFLLFLLFNVVPPLLNQKKAERQIKRFLESKLPASEEAGYSKRQLLDSQDTT